MLKLLIITDQTSLLDLLAGPPKSCLIHPWYNIWLDWSSDDSRVLLRRVLKVHLKYVLKGVLSDNKLRVCMYSGTSNKGPSEIGTTSQQRTQFWTLSHSSSSFLTSEKRTTSQWRTKWLVPKCPLFGGSTVEIILQFSTKLQTRVYCFVLINN